MRLIDADELKKELREFLVKDNHVNNPSTTYLDVLDVVEEQPTAHDKDFINKLAEELSSIHSDDNSWCEYSADKFIDEMVDVAEKLMK